MGQMEIYKTLKQEWPRIGIPKNEGKSRSIEA